MASVDDVVAFLLEQCGTITTYKLHKLLYYSQGWSLAWDGEPLFDAKLKAYEKGPVVSALFGEHRGSMHLSRWSKGDPSNLSDEQKDTVRAVVDRYGSCSADELVDMTHNEAPWLNAWPGDRNVSAREISHDALRAFFTKEANRPTPQTLESRAMGKRLRAFVDGERDPVR